MPFHPNRSRLLMVEKILPLLCPVEGDCSLCEARGTYQTGWKPGGQTAFLCPSMAMPALEVTLIFLSLIFSSRYVNTDFEFIWLFFLKILNCSGDEIS